jgi:stage II sporulation protein M
MDFIRSEYRLAFAFFLRIRKSFLLLLIGFVAAAGLLYAAGIEAYRRQPEQMQQLLLQVVQMFDQKQIVDEQGRISAVRLFLGNVQAAGTTVASGVLPVLFFPAWILALNAAVIGITTSTMLSAVGLRPSFLALALLPHGVLEIPAIALCAAMGVLLCRELTARIFRRTGGRAPLAGLLYDLLRLFVLVVLPLLAAAAAVEAYITPILAAKAL